MNSLLKLISFEGYIPVSKLLSKLLGLNESVILGEFITEYIYYESHNMLTEDDYFYCTVENLEQNVFLSEFFQRKAIRHLCEEGLINIDKRGLPAKRYIHLNIDRIEEIIQSESLGTSSKAAKELENDAIKNKDSSCYRTLNNNKANNNKKNKKEEEARDSQNSNANDKLLNQLTNAELELLKKVVIENRDTQNIKYRDIQRMFNLQNKITYDTPEEIDKLLEKHKQEEEYSKNSSRVEVSDEFF